VSLGVNRNAAESNSIDDHESRPGVGARVFDEFLDSSLLSLLRKMPSLKNIFKKVADIEPVDVQERIHDKIRAFNSIVSILAQIQQGPPFRDNEMSQKNPPNPVERVQLKLSNAFAHLAVANTDVVAATLYTPQALSVMTWLQDQSSDDEDQDKPEAAQDTHQKPRWLWDKICWLFATNTKNTDMRPGSSYPGPRIVKATPPMGYPEGSDTRVNLLEYLDEFPKKW
jgi:hypothetical protein